MKSESFTLKNGVRIFIYPTPYLESVSIAIGVSYGSMDDSDQTMGAAHFLEHMLFKGTKTRTVSQIKEEIRDMGIMWNAYTDFERTTYYFQAYKDNFPKMIELLSDLFLNSTIPKTEFELERGPVLNEELMREDNNQYFFWDHLPKALYKRHPAGRKMVGNRESIKGIKREDLLKIYQTYYTPQNTVVAIYGSVGIEVAKRLAEKYFSKFNKREVKKQRPLAREPQVKNEVTVRKENIKQAIIGVGFKCREFHPSTVRETTALITAARVLNYRITDEVREKRGLSYIQWASYFQLSTFGFIAVQAGVEPKKIQEVKGIILEEFEKMRKGQITEDDIKKAKEGLIAQYRILRENTMAMANSITSMTLTTGDYKYTENLPDLISQVKLADVKKYCKKYIKTKSYSSVILKPE
ncbi:MAG: insulinase family protein [Candidatus Micrarchaeota archaeon]|nr:insulinase family protein [Candidatus Micrarchaeota archaeon]